MRDLKTELYLTVHSSRKSVEHQADECGISASYLYRACLEGEAGCRFPLELLLPLMHATNDYRVLDALNARCNRVTASMPRVGRLKQKDPQTINDITRNFNSAMAKLLEFYETPTDELREEIESELHRHLCEITAMKRSVKDFKQGDLL